MITKIDSSIVPYDNLIRALCRTPYYGHSKGCPNYDKKEGCPPQKLITDVLDFDRELYLIFTEFPIGEFAEKMRITHPEWKESTYPDHPKRTSEFVQSIEGKLRERRPEWPDEYYAQRNTEQWTSARDWYNPRRWQPTARKEHREEVQRFLAQYPDLVIDRCPEAHGINLTGLMHEIGIELQWRWPPIHDLKNKSYIISIGGSPSSSGAN
ncbi:hypothetical protein JXB28_05050 [Candidatus Woesearchaeota archaeon]|nr:hypothetical protein [Candidatus Woesearchaeota archaeon]